MFEFIKNLFGGDSNAPKIDYKTLIAEGAIVIDVREIYEFEGGNAPGSINIPLTHLSAKMPSLDKSKVIITCCASGMRSASARTTMLREGFAEVHNAGSWKALV